MNSNDRQPFATAMTTLFAIYGDELTPSILDAWWSIFQEHDLEAITQSMNAHVVDHKAGMFKPTPAHIIDRMTFAATTMRAEMAKIRSRLQVELRALDDKIYKAENDYRHGLISKSIANNRIALLKTEWRQVVHKDEYAGLRQYQKAIRHQKEGELS